jgi:hypothetical protein
MRRLLVAAGLAAALTVALGGASTVTAGAPAGHPPGTAISLTTSLTFFDTPGCDFTRRRPCASIGSFVADDTGTSTLLCPSGSMAESYYFPTHGPAFTIAERTLTCPDGSTLLLHVERVEFTDLSPTTGLVGQTWKVTLGTGRFSLLSGRGDISEVFDFGVEPATLAGTLSGTLRD